VLAFHKEFTRLCIPTANLVDYDWHSVENAVWIQDFPLRDPQLASDPSGASTQIGTTLASVFTSLGVPRGLWVPGLHNTDLSRGDENARLVFSRAGCYQDSSIDHTTVEDWRESRYGHPALARSLRELGCVPSENEVVEIEYQGSSIGNYSDVWLREFYNSSCGLAPEFGGIASHFTGKKKPNDQLRIKVIFPTLETVKSSVLGPDGAHTLFCRSSTWNALNFPRHLFHDGLSKRTGVLMHTKMILGTFRRRDNSGSSNQSSNRAFLYVGSHNFTASAWGRILPWTKTKPRRLQISNYELGIVLKMTEKDASDAATWARPCTPYGRDDVAWMQVSYSTARAAE